MAMNPQETEIFKSLIGTYKDYWDRNEYNRINYDNDLEKYLGYRNARAYPLAYNEVFNRILPIIYTILSRFMSQMYQGGDIVSVKARTAAGYEGARRVQGVLNHQLGNLNAIDAQGGSYLVLLKWFFNALTFGKGIMKTYWRKEERISPRRVQVPVPKLDNQGRVVGIDITDHLTQDAQIVYDGPYAEVIHNKLFVPHPEYKSIQQMPACFIVYKKPIDHIHNLVAKGVYHNIDELGWESAGHAGQEPRDSNEAFVRSLDIEGGLRTEDLRTDFKTPDVDIVESYIKLIWKDEPYEVGSGLKIKGPEEESIVHIGNYKTILSAQRNPYGVRPLFDVGAYLHPELYWDVGLVGLCSGLQEQINTLGNLRIQNAMMQVNQMLKVRADADIDPESLIYRPFGLIPVEEMDDVEPLIVPDTGSNIFMEQERFYDNTIQDLTGMYSFNMGQTPVRQEKVGVVQSLQAMGEARAKLMLMSMDYTGVRPWLNYMMILNTYHLQNGFEFRVNGGDNSQFNKIFSGDIHPDYDFEAKYTAMEPALGKGARAQQLVQMAALWKDNPWINQFQWNRVLMELLDVQEAPFMLKTPDQMQKEIEAQQQAQQLAQQQAQREDLDKNLAISDKDFNEDIVLNDQEFGHDLVLKTIELEAKSNAETT